MLVLLEHEALVGSRASMTRLVTLIEIYVASLKDASGSGPTSLIHSSLLSEFGVIGVPVADALKSIRGIP